MADPELILDYNKIFTNAIAILIGLVFLTTIWYLVKNWSRLMDLESINLEKQIIELEKKRKLERGETIEINEDVKIKNDRIFFYKDINFNDPEPFILLPGQERIVFERKLDDNRLPGSEKDMWHFESLRFEGEVNYQIKVEMTDKSYEVITLADLSNTRISNIIDWLSFNLPKEENEIINNPNRMKIIFRINKRFDELSGTGIPDVNAILYTGLNYRPSSEFSVNQYRKVLKPNEPIEICHIESRYSRLPTGQYNFDENNNIRIKKNQQKTWFYRSLKFNQDSILRLTVKEEIVPEKQEIIPGMTLETKYTERYQDFTPSYNLSNIILWLELQDQEIFKYNPLYPVLTERKYYLELIN